LWRPKCRPARLAPGRSNYVWAERRQRMLVITLTVTIALAVAITVRIRITRKPPKERTKPADRKAGPRSLLYNTPNLAMLP